MVRVVICAVKVKLKTTQSSVYTPTRVMCCVVNDGTGGTSPIFYTHFITPSYSWQTYLINCVAKIQELSRIEEWRYINTKENSSDIISRCALPEVFLSSSLWTHRPEFLQLPAAVWPQHNVYDEVKLNQCFCQPT